ncbi:hypothetical protein UFOVP655_26 [uncultured Caudovirales phage]|uniref:Uncharacterized protein n=1 Tax=uncultured Caudovirales phage TaxID=2100421 RepID=A0A6J5NBD8_9CAUD|nr:hypothetical protein UFOVP655_26 [uncultured Caudovirales phage]
MVSKEFAVKIDTQLSELHSKRYNLVFELKTVEDTLEFYQNNYSYRFQDNSKYENQIESIKKQISEVNSEIRGLNEIYNQDPWTRAFLVIASNGHVHSSMDCSTCFDTTRYQWLVQYSNDDENTIVEDAGEDACTICYPSAPAEVLNRPSRIVTADKIAKAEAKAERDAKKAERIAKEKANAPTISGEFLYIKDGKYTQVIKTERSAVTEWFSQYDKSQREIVTHYYDGKAHSEESIQEQKDRKAHAGEIAQLICYRLAEKHGIGYEEQEAILIKKYGKRGY